MAGTPLYEEHTRCHDLEGIGAVSLLDPDSWLESQTPEVVVEAVRARQSLGGACEEKIDGCYLELHLGPDGRVDTVTSRAGLDHQYAQDWKGEQLRDQLHGWTIIGELVAGTHWASQQREAGELPVLVVYGMVGRAGRVCSFAEVSKKVRWIHHPRIRLVRYAAEGEDWGDFAERVLAEGGEGVVLKQADGNWRAKPLITVDRVVRRVYQEPDRHGAMRWKADVGRRRGYGTQTVQTVLVPEWVGRPRRDLARRRVVTLTGSCVGPSGVVRHGRIAQVRLRGEVQARECV